MGKPIGTDFIAFWTGSELILNGEPEAIYGLRHYEAQQTWFGRTDVGFNSWHYPPVFHLLIWPLATLPYAISLAVWSATTLSAYLYVVYKIFPRREAVAIALAFPAVFVNLGHGQTGFLTATLLGGALIMLDGRPWLAGVLIGFLAIKPQYGVLLPLVLAVTDRWQTFLLAALTVLVLALVTTVVFGLDTWLAFFNKFGFIRLVLVEGLGGYGKMQSVFAAIRLMGGSLEVAYIIHAISGIAALTVVTWVWRQTVSFPLKAAGLVIGTLLISPYVLDYDLVLLAMPIAWLALQGCRTGFLPWEKSILVATWLFPFLSRATASAGSVQLAPVIVWMVMLLIVRRAITENASGTLRVTRVAGTVR